MALFADAALTIPPLLEARSLGKAYEGVTALEGVSLTVHAGEIVCVLGEDGAGKSTLVRILAGVEAPDSGGILVGGRDVRLGSPHDALRHGIAIVHQDIAVSPLLSVTRSFFLGVEPTVGLGPFRRFDARTAERVCREELLDLGIDLADPSRAIGSLTADERRGVAIARAMHFATRVVILDEPAASLGLEGAAAVLRQVVAAEARGLGVILATRRVDHAYPVGDRFLVLERGRVAGAFHKSDVSRADLLALLGRGAALDRLGRELEAYAGEVGHLDVVGHLGRVHREPAVHPEPAVPVEDASSGDPLDPEDPLPPPSIAI